MSLVAQKIYQQMFFAKEAIAKATSGAPLCLLGPRLAAMAQGEDGQEPARHSITTPEGQHTSDLCDNATKASRCGITGDDERIVKRCRRAELRR